MGVSFVCPNCRKLVDPMSPNAMMASATKLWQHKDCETGTHARRATTGPPKVERRKRPRR